MKKLLTFALALANSILFAQIAPYNTSKFKQLKEELATPNIYRTGSGAPGHKYYQNNANYKMDIVINEDKQTLTGKEEIEYVNNSPDELTYLWIQLDQNVRAKDSDSKKIKNSSTSKQMSFKNYTSKHREFDGGFKIEKVSDLRGKNLPYTINNTMMRVDLAKPLKSGEKFSLKIDWWYNINNRAEIGGRSGLEYFKEEDNYIFTIAQFFPRMCVYSDIEGWQNKQFLGHGEFTLPFGNYNVNLTVPADHIVAATGKLNNPKNVLSSKQQQRFKKAQNTFDKPVFIVTEDEAKDAEKKKVTKTKTWNFKAQNVRDFAFASSRKFIWDAMAVKQTSKNVMAMSYYPKEGNPLWEKYSTHAVAQTLETYSKHTFDYPYPVAISVHTDRIGMEYPMICFNGGRPEADGTYSAYTKHGMISVIIHEVGHFYFPMIVNSDERQWTWMDEGLNTFLQFLTEQEWDLNYPSRRGPAHKIVSYMKGEKKNITPIMTNSESLLQFGNNAYGKPATALNILRETVMGRELFDFAFKTYAQRWMFKHPSPADFFRTMEDASAVDLDWFWRGWFYTTDHVDISLDNVEYLQVNTKNPETEKGIKKQRKENEQKGITYNRNSKRKSKTRIEKYPELNDFYNTYDANNVSPKDKENYNKEYSKLNKEQKDALADNYHYYNLSFSNKGGLVMPVIVEFTFTDASKETFKMPAEFWVRNNEKAKKDFWFTKKVSKIIVDPYLETADTDLNNNSWPKEIQPTRFDLFKQRQRPRTNPMQNR